MVDRRLELFAFNRELVPFMGRGQKVTAVVGVVITTATAGELSITADHIGGGSGFYRAIALPVTMPPPSFWDQLHGCFMETLVLAILAAFVVFWICVLIKKQQ